MKKKTMLLDATYIKAITIKKIFEGLKEYVKECNMFCDNEGFHISANDSLKICYIELHLSDSHFKSYKCTERLCLGINVEGICDVFKSVKNDDKVTFQTEPSVTNPDNIQKLRITISSNNAIGDISYTIDFYLMDIRSETYAIPELDYNSVIELPSSDFQSLIKYLSSLGDTLEFHKVTNDSITLVTTGKRGKVEALIETTKPVAVAVAVPVTDDKHGGGASSNKKARLLQVAQENECFMVNIDQQSFNSSMYGMKHLLMFTKCSMICDRTSIKFGGDDVPLLVEFMIKKEKQSKQSKDPSVASLEKEEDSDSVTSPSWLRCYLAPKIPDEDFALKLNV